MFAPKMHERFFVLLKVKITGETRSGLNNVDREKRLWDIPSIGSHPNTGERFINIINRNRANLGRFDSSHDEIQHL
jgi:hypothetical protein